MYFTVLDAETNNICEIYELVIYFYLNCIKVDDDYNEEITEYKYNSIIITDNIFKIILKKVFNSISYNNNTINYNIYYRYVYNQQFI